MSQPATEPIRFRLGAQPEQARAQAVAVDWRRAALDRAAARQAVMLARARHSQAVRSQPC